MSAQRAPRLIVTAADGDGKSGVSKVFDLDSFLLPGTPVRNQLWQLAFAGFESGPNDLPPESDIDCPPGTMGWRIVRMTPGRKYELHKTPTIDIDSVLHGNVQLILDSGPMDLASGDYVVLPAVAHGWHVGTDGCTLSVVMMSPPLH
jgi:hypothetical protein